MDEYIKRKDAVERIKTDCDRFDHIPKRVVKFFTLGMESVPSADVVEVVRCEDCEHWKCNPNTDKYGVCQKVSYDDFEVVMECDDFCSYGKKKEQKND